MRHFSFDKPHTRGADLSPVARRSALARYVHRYTGNHKPDWARGIWRNGKTYPVQFADDADWLANTLFNVTARGLLVDASCYSCPTWPRNPELRLSKEFGQW